MRYTQHRKPASLAVDATQGYHRMIGEKTPEVEAYWQAFRAATGAGEADYHAATFADPGLSANVGKIGRLARSGEKRATCHLALDFARNGVRRREAGDCLVVLDEAGAPLCIVRVTEVAVTPFDAVGPELAVAEGEGDLSRDYWATVHRRYFEKQCAKWGVDWREDREVVCEYFDLVWTGA